MRRKHDAHEAANDNDLLRSIVSMPPSTKTAQFYRNKQASSTLDDHGNYGADSITAAERTCFFAYTYFSIR